MRGILDQHQTAGGSQRGERIQLGRMPRVVHDDDRARARREHRFHRRRVQIQRVRLDVGKDDARAHVLDHVGRRRERERGRHHLVARPDAGRGERHVHCGGTGAQRERARGAEVRGELLLEAPRLRPGRDPGRAQRVHDLRDLLLTECVTAERQVLTPHRESTAPRRGGTAAAPPAAQCP